MNGELKDIVKQTALYDKKIQDYDLAILKSESRDEHCSTAIGTGSWGK